MGFTCYHVSCARDASLGAHTLIVSNAAGGVNPAIVRVTSLLIRDQPPLPGLAGAEIPRWAR